MDKGSTTNIFYQNFINGLMLFANLPAQASENTPIGPHLFLSPWTVTRPGQIQVQLTNLSANVANIQIMLYMAVSVAEPNGVVNAQQYPNNHPVTAYAVAPGGGGRDLSPQYNRYEASKLTGVR
jgi:hypothetical protein